MARLFSERAAFVSAALGGPYHDAVLVDFAAPTYDSGGSITAAGARQERACKAQVDSVTQDMRAAEGFSDGDVRILVLADGVTGSITTDSRIEITAGPHEGNWLVKSTNRDPFGVYWELRGRRA